MIHPDERTIRATFNADGFDNITVVEIDGHDLAVRILSLEATAITVEHLAGGKPFAVPFTALHAN